MTTRCAALAAMLAAFAATAAAQPIGLLKLDNAVDPQRIDIRFTGPFQAISPGLYFLNDGPTRLPLLSLEFNVDLQGLAITSIPGPIGPNLQPYPKVYTLEILGILGLGEIVPQNLSIPVVFFNPQLSTLRETVSLADGTSALEDTWVRIAEANVSSFTFDDDTVFVETTGGVTPPAGLRLKRPGISGEVSFSWEIRTQGFLKTDATGNLFINTRQFQAIPWPSRSPRAPIIPTVKLIDTVKEEDESKLLMLEGEFTSPRRGADTFVGGQEYDFTDATGTITVVITPASGLDGEPIPTGTIRLFGIIIQDDTTLPFLDGYKIAPRDAQDLQEPASASANWDLY